MGKVLPRAKALGFLFCANLATARRIGPSSWLPRVLAAYGSGDDVKGLTNRLSYIAVS